MNCLFCKIIDGSINSKKVYENEFVFAFLDVSPVSYGHTLVIPKKHFENFSECDDHYLSEVSKASKHVSNLLSNSIDNIQGFNFVSNQGSEAFQMVFHFHQHVIPKYKKTEGFVTKNNIVEKIDIDKSFEQITK
ncbi:HIT family protein [Spiroplasma endosymbiont of Othius punctulatus]|uniref:HIT family protein n=1 Tax=Spiroplasma endosymbiont of Othius punctulatus TaxID=3066289 RepID=UPI0030D1D3E6